MLNENNEIENENENMHNELFIVIYIIFVWLISFLSLVVMNKNHYWELRLYSDL